MSQNEPQAQASEPIQNGQKGRSWWQADGPTSGKCSNCEHVALKTYCESCGQRVVVGPLTLRSLLRELPSRFVSLDRGFLKTFVDLTLKPGAVSYDYVRGVRKRYANPLAYFFVGATIQLVSLTVLRGSMIQFITERLEAAWGQNPSLIEKIERGLGEDAIGVIADLIVDLTRNAYSYLWIFFCLIFALSFRCLPFAGKRRFNLSEIFVFSIYSIGHTVLLLGLVALIYVPLFGFESWTIIIWPIYGILLSRAAIQFFKGTWTAVVATLISLVVAFNGYLLIFYSALILQIALRVRAGG